MQPPGFVQGMSARSSPERDEQVLNVILSKSAAWKRGLRSVVWMQTVVAGVVLLIGGIVIKTSIHPYKVGSLVWQTRVERVI
jgi:hypothetical protein